MYALFERFWKFVSQSYERNTIFRVRERIIIRGEMHFSKEWKDFGNSYHNLTNGYLEWEVGNFFPVGEKGGGGAHVRYRRAIQFPEKLVPIFPISDTGRPRSGEKFPVGGGRKNDRRQTRSLLIPSGEDFSNFLDSARIQLEYRFAPFPRREFSLVHRSLRGEERQIFETCVYIYIYLSLPSKLS